jgi:hypothetical protein
VVDGDLVRADLNLERHCFYGCCSGLCESLN